MLLARQGWVSLAHGDGFAAAAFSQNAPVGIDLERERPLDPGMAEMILLPCESEEVRAAASPSSAFTRLFVRKEALGKAYGRGLDTPVLACDTRPSNVRVGGVSYTLEDLDAPPGFQAALCMRLP